MKRFHVPGARLKASLLAASMLSVLSVVSASEALAEKATLKLAYSADYMFSTPDLATKWFEGVKSGFEASHPDVTVQLVPIAGGFDDFITKLSLMYNNAGTAPDVSQIPAQEAGQFAESDVLAPLDDRLKGASWWANFPDPIKKEGSVRGKVYAVSQGVNTSALLYDHGVFKKAGLPDDWQPKNWADILVAARAIKKSSPDVWPLWLLTGTAGGSESVVLGGANMVATSSDPGFYDESTGKWIVDSKGIREALNFYRQAALEGLLAPSSQILNADAPGNVSPLLNKHQLGIAIAGNYVPLNFNKTICTPCWDDVGKDIGFAPIPTSQGQAPGIGSAFGGWDLSLSSKSAHPDLAWQLIDYAQQKKDMILVDNWGGLNPPMPSLNTDPTFVAFSPDFNEKFAKLVPISSAAPANADYKVWAFAFLQATEALVLKPEATSVDDAVKMMTTYVSGQLEAGKIEVRK